MAIMEFSSPRREEEQRDSKKNHDREEWKKRGKLQTPKLSDAKAEQLLENMKLLHENGKGFRDIEKALAASVMKQEISGPDITKIRNYFKSLKPREP